MEIIRAGHRFKRPEHFPYSVVEYRCFYGCDYSLIATQSADDRERDLRNGTDVGSRMAEVTRRSGFELKDIRVIYFSEGEGITVAQLLAESLADMHTYPESDCCAHVWLDYCSWQRDNSDKARKWWRGMTKLLKPDLVKKFDPIYVPVHASRELARSLALAA